MGNINPPQPIIRPAIRELAKWGAQHMEGQLPADRSMEGGAGAQQETALHHTLIEIQNGTLVLNQVKAAILHECLPAYDQPPFFLNAWTRAAEVVAYKKGVVNGTARAYAALSTAVKQMQQGTNTNPCRRVLHAYYLDKVAPLDPGKIKNMNQHYIMQLQQICNDYHDPQKQHQRYQAYCSYL